MLSHMDHLVLTVRDPEASSRFYCDVLGLERQDLDDGRTALVGAGWKINLHHSARPVAPHAEHPVPGSADLCFILTVPMEVAMARLEAHDVDLELGPVTRAGARGPILSVYIRDPDRNLIELSVSVDQQCGAPRRPGSANR